MGRGQEILAVLERQPQWVMRTLALALVACVGLLDYATGDELLLSVLYVVPVGFAAWFSSRRTAYMVVAVAAFTWYQAGHWAVHSYTEEWTRYWNGLSPFLLMVMILHFVYMARRQLDRERERADRDPLTGLLNMHPFVLQAEEELARARRFKRPFAVAFMDLDNFKAVNDRHGHVAGDTVLREVAQCMRRVLRESDLIARAGGDEFVALMVEAEPEGALAATETLRDELLKTMAHLKCGVTFSIGLAIYTSPPPDVRTMIHFADQLMYEVKHGGKNGIRSAVIGWDQLHSPS